VDLKSIQKEEQERRKKYEEEEKRMEEEARNQPTPEASPEMEEPEIPTGEQPMTSPEPEPEPTMDAEQPAEVITVDPQTSSNATLSAGPQRGTDEVSPMMFSLYGAFFGG